MRWTEIFLFIVGFVIMLGYQLDNWVFTNAQVICTIIFCTIFIMVKIPDNKLLKDFKVIENKYKKMLKEVERMKQKIGDK